MVAEQFTLMDAVSMFPFPFCSTPTHLYKVVQIQDGLKMKPFFFFFFSVSHLCVSISFQDLFKKVVPYHCLGGIWSQRDKKGKEHLAPTIRATVAQFNSVTNCVITTCLSNPTLKPNQRARLLERWIDVARVSKHRWFTQFICNLDQCSMYLMVLQQIWLLKQ